MLRVLLEKVNVLVLQVGGWPSRSRIKAPASLWLAIASLYDDVKKLEEENLKGSMQEVTLGILRTSEDALAGDIGQLRNDTLGGFGDVESQIELIKGETFSSHLPYKHQLHF